MFAATSPVIRENARTFPATAYNSQANAYNIRAVARISRAVGKIILANA